MISAIRYLTWSEMLPLNKCKVAALAVYGKSCCYASTSLRGPGHLLESELCTAFVRLE